VTVPGPPVTFTVSVYVLTGGGGGGAGGSGGSGAGRACPELAEIMRLEVSTASKALPGMRWNELTRSSSFQRESGAPLTYQALPLSARMMP
jgi:hypothetical protein